MLKGRSGFAIGQILLILMLSSFLIMASFPIISMKNKASGGNNTDVIKCIVSEGAANLSSASCSIATTSTIKERSNAFNTVLSYIDSSNSVNSEAARKVLFEVCRKNNDKACKFFINECILDSNLCNSPSNYDLNSLIGLIHNDVTTSLIMRLVNNHYKVGNSNITNAIYNACSANTSSAACKYIKNRCEDGEVTPCTYFVNRCKNDGVCDVAGINFDLLYFLSQNFKTFGKFAKIILNLTDPLYKIFDSNIVQTVNTACTSNINSVACNINDPNETNCINNNTDSACLALSDECVAGNSKKCSSLVTACNNGRTNACKYGYINDINKSCNQIKLKLGSLYQNSETYYRLSTDNIGNSTNRLCTDGWTVLFWYQSFSNTSLINAWTNPGQTSVSRLVYGSPITASEYILGGKDVLSGTGYASNMYLEKTFDYYNIPHNTVRVSFTNWYCGSWSGEKIYLHYNDIFNSATGQLYNSSPTDWKTLDGSQYCRSVGIPVIPISDTINSGTIKVFSDLTSPPSDKSFGITSFNLWLK